ncbi:MAG: MltR family transcriptional regulator [Chlorobiales bacterium]|nr:MltR family transcriptional regulator [Chlorobiales bacterium]
MHKRQLPPIERLSKETQHLFNVLNEEKDLSVILVASSFLDACLGSILKRKLKRSSISEKLLDSSGVLSARADLSYTLNLISKPLYQDLIKIAEIRNEIAHHHLALSFETESIMSKCSQLSYVSSLKNGNTGDSLDMEQWMIEPRNQFVMTTVMISQRLLLIGLGVRNGENEMA